MSTTRHAEYRLLRISEAAEYLNVSDRFIRRLVAERRIDFIKVGRFVRIGQDALDSFLSEGTVERVR